MLLGRGKRKIKADEPERRCIASGVVQKCSGLIRFVLAPDGTVTPDISGRLPGRGLWVSAKRSELKKAIKKNAFSRAAKTQAIIPDGLLELVEELLLKHTINMVSMARKVGVAYCGFDKVKSALMNDTIVVLMQASDGSAPQKRKLRPPDRENSYISCLKAAELGLAFGREHVIHAALARGGLTNKIRTETARLSAVRGEEAITEAKAAGDPAVKGY